MYWQRIAPQLSLLSYDRFLTAPGELDRKRYITQHSRMTSSGPRPVEAIGIMFTAQTIENASHACGRIQWHEVLRIAFVSRFVFQNRDHIYQGLWVCALPTIISSELPPIQDTDDIYVGSDQSYMMSGLSLS